MDILREPLAIILLALYIIYLFISKDYKHFSDFFFFLDVNMSAFFNTHIPIYPFSMKYILSFNILFCNPIIFLPRLMFNNQRIRLSIIEKKKLIYALIF